RTFLSAFAPSGATARQASRLVTPKSAGRRRNGRLAHCEASILTYLPHPAYPPYPSCSWVIWYCSILLYRLLRGVPITSAVFEMFQPFSRSLPTRNMRSAFSLNSRSVPILVASLSLGCFGEASPPLAPDQAAGERTLSGRSGTSMISPLVMMLSRSTVLRSSRMLPFQR